MNRRRKKVLTREDVAQLIFDEIERRGTARALCREWGVSAGRMSEMLTGPKNKGYFGKKVLDRLGIRRVCKVRRIVKITYEWADRPA